MNRRHKLMPLHQEIPPNDNKGGSKEHKYTSQREWETTGERFLAKNLNYLFYKYLLSTFNAMLNSKFYKSGR